MRPVSASSNAACLRPQPPRFNAAGLAGLNDTNRSPSHIQERDGARNRFVLRRGMVASPEEIRDAALEEAAKLAEFYAETNMEICQDNILLDPLLHGKPWTDENMKRSRECSINSTIHSAGYHAGNHLAERIRALKTRTEVQAA